MYTLQLNADYTPLRIVPWQRAVELVLAGKAATVTAWAGRFVRSPSFACPWPAVVVTRRYTQVRPRVRFSPRNVAARDGWRCVYCGLAPTLEDGRPDRRALTLDHVIPRAQARHGAVYLPWSRRWVNVTCWENSATACKRCNHVKADRTPAEAGLALRTLPRAPTAGDALRIQFGRLAHVPTEWAPYLPAAWHAESVPAPARADLETDGR